MSNVYSKSHHTDCIVDQHTTLWWLLALEFGILVFYIKHQVQI